MRSFAVIGCILGVATIGAMNMQSLVNVILKFSAASHQFPILVLVLFILYISHILLQIASPNCLNCSNCGLARLTFLVLGGM